MYRRPRDRLGIEIDAPVELHVRRGDRVIVGLGRRIGHAPRWFVLVLGSNTTRLIRSKDRDEKVKE